MKLVCQGYVYMDKLVMGKVYPWWLLCGVMDSVFTYHLYHIGGTCVCMYCSVCNTQW